MLRGSLGLMDAADRVKGQSVVTAVIGTRASIYCGYIASELPRKSLQKFY